jgi:hypothetical protein
MQGRVVCLLKTFIGKREVRNLLDSNACNVMETRSDGIEYVVSCAKVGCDIRGSNRATGNLRHVKEVGANSSTSYSKHDA